MIIKIECVTRLDDKMDQIQSTWIDGWDTVERSNTLPHPLVDQHETRATMVHNFGASAAEMRENGLQYAALFLYGERNGTLEVVEMQCDAGPKDTTDLDVSYVSAAYLMSDEGKTIDRLL